MGGSDRVSGTARRARARGGRGLVLAAVLLVGGVACADDAADDPDTPGGAGAEGGGAEGAGGTTGDGGTGGTGGTAPGGTAPGGASLVPGEGGGPATTGTGGGAPSTTGSPGTAAPSGGGGPTTDPNGPDLVLWSLPECSVVPGGALDGADALTLFVAVRNGGPGSVDSLVPVTVSSDSGLGASVSSGISEGSATSALNVSVGAGAYGRSHRFTVVADPGNQVVERDESNNGLVVVVDLGSRPASGSDVPCSLG